MESVTIVLSKRYQRWIDKIPEIYRNIVLDSSSDNMPDVANDPFNLASLKHYRSLMPLAMEANKPMFFLKPSDGAIGAHVEAVKTCYQDFEKLSERIYQPDHTTAE